MATKIQGGEDDDVSDDSDTECGDEDESDEAADEDESDTESDDMGDEDGSDEDVEDDSVEGDDGPGDEDSELDFHNESEPTDVNNDGSTTALDALVVMNFLSTHGNEFLQTLTLALQHYVDVNNDNSASALDALQIINALNSTLQNSNQTLAVDSVFGSGELEEDEVDDVASMLF